MQEKREQDSKRRRVDCCDTCDATKEPCIVNRKNCDSHQTSVSLLSEMEMETETETETEMEPVSTSSATSPPYLPALVLARHVLPFLDWSSWNHLSIACKELYDASRSMSPPWYDGVFATDSAVYSVAFNPDSTMLAIAGAYGLLQIWDRVRRKTYDFKSCRDAHSRNHEGPGIAGDINSVAFSNDGNWFASAGDDRKVCIWKYDAQQIQRQQEQEEQQQQQQQQQCITRSKENNRARDEKNDVKQTESLSERPWSCIRKLKHPRTQKGSRVQCVQFSSCSSMVLSGTEDGRVRIWNRETGSLLRILRVGQGMYTVTCLALTPCGNYFAVGASDHYIRIKQFGASQQQLQPIHAGRDAQLHRYIRANQRLHDNRQQQQQREQASTTILLQCNQVVNDIAFSTDGNLLASGCRNESEIPIYDATKPHYPTIDGSPLRGHTSSITSLKFIDHCRLLSASEDSSVRLWNVLTQECLWMQKGGKARCFLSVDITSSNPRVIVGSSTTRKVCLWNLPTDIAESIATSNEVESFE